LRILWHRARYGLTIRATARAFVVEPSTVHRWFAMLERGRRRLFRTMRALKRLPDLVREVALLLRAEEPRWGTRRLAHVLARLGVKVSRSSVQRIVRCKPRTPRGRPATVRLVRRGGIQARHPHHVWLIDITTIKLVFGLLDVRIAAVLDAF